MTDSFKVVFIDSEQEHTSNMIDSLQKRYPLHITHITSREELNGFTSKYSADIVFVDVTFYNIDSGLNIFRKLNKQRDIITIPIVPEDNSFITTSIIQENPFFYLTKPYQLPEIECVFRRSIERIEFLKLQKKRLQEDDQFCGIIGKTFVMTKLFDLIGRIADDDVTTVLIRGESGTGKELVAKAIHQKSKRKNNNFVPVNCAAIPDDLLESELFGYTKGAFTGANHSKQGRIQYADGGTLFLDEIGDMKPSLQAKLLRVLQEKEFEPVGGLQPTPVNTRIVAATHCDLEQLVKEGNFREDLYYRLSVIPLNIPPLKDRREDLPHLIDKFVDSYTVQRGREPFTFSDSSLSILRKYSWKGNVRELENLIQHMSILYSGSEVLPSDLPEKFLDETNHCEDELDTYTDPSEQVNSQQTSMIPSFTEDTFIFDDQEIDFNKLINDFETSLIINALKATGGNKKEAAKLLKLKRTTLLEKIKKKNLTPDNW